MKLIEWNLVPSTPAGTASSNRIYSLVSDALTAGDVRPPPASVRESRRQACAVLVANLMVAKKAGLIAPWHAVRKPSRYVRVARAGFEKVVAAMQAQNLIRVVRHYGQGDRANEVHPTHALLTMFAGCGAADCALDPESEIVIVKDRLNDYGEPNSRAELVDYEDTDYTESVRADVRTINAHLAGRAHHPRHGGNHALRRYYCRGSFEKGGRLFGHWGQSIKKAERARLLIDGSPAVAVDFPAMFARLLEAAEDRQAPAGDLYAFPEHPTWQRPGVKRVFNAVLCREQPSHRFPRGMAAEGWFPPSVRFPVVVHTIGERYPAWARYANTGYGLTLMRAESDVLINACLWLVERGIGFVPVHDALLVPVFEAGRAQYALWQAFRAVTGISLAPGAEPVVTAYTPEARALLPRLMG